MKLDRKLLEAAVKEIKDGYSNRYGKAYVEAHLLANAVPELLQIVDLLEEQVNDLKNVIDDLSSVI